MFFKDTNNVFKLEPFEQFEWLHYGFGTRLAEAWPPPGKLVTLKQIHSDIAVRVCDGEGYVGKGDALMTDCPGRFLTIRTADCLPLILVDPVRRAVAVVHAGWRGSAAAISAKTVQAMAREFSSRTEEVMAAVGPGIGACCYQVGPDVASEFRPYFPERSDLDGRTVIDLVEANRRQLLASGLRPENIFAGAPCTHCDREHFHSYRRDRDNGRMISGVGIL